jgi:hypothetical protein
MGFVKCIIPPKIDKSFCHKEIKFFEIFPSKGFRPARKWITVVSYNCIKQLYQTTVRIQNLTRYT